MSNKPPLKKPPVAANTNQEVDPDIYNRVQDIKKRMTEFAKRDQELMDSLTGARENIESLKSSHAEGEKRINDMHEHVNDIKNENSNFNPTNKPKLNESSNKSNHLNTAAKVGAGALAAYGAYRIGKHLYNKRKQKMSDKNMEKIARSANIKRRIREASPAAVFDHHASRGHDNRMLGDTYSGMRKNRILDQNAGKEEKGRSINISTNHYGNQKPSEVLRDSSPNELNTIKSNILATKHTRRTFAEGLRNATAEDNQSLRDFRDVRKSMSEERSASRNAHDESVGKKKLINGKYLSPKEQWRSTNNPPKPKINIYGKPLDPSAPKSTFSKNASEYEGMNKEAKSKNIMERLRAASETVRNSYENSKKARTPKDYDPTMAVHEHHQSQYEKPKNIGKKPKIKSIDDFLNNTFY